MSFNGSGTFQINTAGQPVVTGTVISSTAFNALTADLATGLSTCVTKDGQTNPTANLPMAGFKLTGLGNGSAATDSATLGQVQGGVVSLINSISGTDTITGSLSPALTAYAAGQMFYFVAAGANTGAVTLNINSLGAKSVTRDGSTALVAGDIASGEVVIVVYDGTRFQTIGPNTFNGTLPVANGGTGQTSYTNGQLLIGNTTGNTLTKATLTAGTGVTITNGAGSITIAGLTGITSSTVTALGTNAGDSVTSATATTTIGFDAGTAITSGSSNTCVGYGAGKLISTSPQNTAVGNAALDACTTGNGVNAAFGENALGALTTGYSCVGLGNGAGTGITTASFSTAVGFEAGYTGNYSSATMLGEGAVVTGNSQIQLGASGTTTYAYGAVQDRSDARDKTDIRDTQLGLNFILALRPRDYKWDMRDDYRPAKPSADATSEEWAAFHEACKLANLTHDGTHKRNRYHHGLVAQEVKQTMDAMGVDFGGYQDHTIKGGDAVMSIGYEELVAPLIKAIQELKAEFDAYKASHP